MLKEALLWYYQLLNQDEVDITDNLKHGTLVRRFSIAMASWYAHSLIIALK